MNRRRWLAIALATLLLGGGAAVLAPSANAGTQTFTASADTYVQADRPTENFGTSTRWSVEGRPNIWRHGLVRFNAAIPTGEKVTSAKVRAYSEGGVSAGECVDIYQTTGGWTEAGVTWNNAPARGTWQSKACGFATGQWVEWDVTKAIGAGGAVSFKLETGAQRWAGFKSRQATNTALRPQLVLTTEAGTTPPPPTGDGTTAAATLGWGATTAGDEFNYTGPADPGKWSVYNSPGHAGNGVRSPAQVTVDGSKLIIDGKADGTTGGMSAKFANQKYGRWESRVAIPAGDNEYHGVGILWPDSGNWPCDGEVDYFENLGDRSVINFFHHYSCDNKQTQASKPIDVTQFHNYAVDWSPAGITGYIDGVQWFQDNDPAHQPPGSMHQTLQLDWFPDSTADGTGQLLVDWVRVYAAASSPPPPPPPTGGVVDVAAVGDMNPSGNTSTSSDSGKNAASIVGSLGDGTLDSFIGIGDFQYDKGTCSALTSYWAKLWGPVIPKTYWTTGPNHDVQPGTNDDVDKFMNGECSGSTARSATNVAKGGFVDALEWYSYDQGNWHFLVAPTATWRYDSSRAAAMTAEMDTDLKAAKAAGKHLAVIYHDPYFTSNTDGHARFSEAKPWIDMFWANRVRVLLSGSQHNYERTCPVNNNDQCVADGMQQFQVSTGGIGLRAFTSNPAYVEKKFSDTWGHIRLALADDGSYTWKFVAVSGGMQTDSGSRPAA